MIIFFDKNSGKIVGTIDGRINSQVQLNMWIGDKTNVDRLICQWENKGKGFEPVSSDDQKSIFIALDKSPSEIFKYKVDLQSKKLVLI